MQPSILPTPPITTTINAFMVKTTPDDALKVRNVLTSTPAAATSAPPSAKRQRGSLRHVDRDKLGGKGIDGDGAYRRAGAGPRQRQIEREAKQDGDAERGEAVGRDGLAEKLHRKGKERVAVVSPAEQREHRALNDEGEAEGRENAVDLERVAVGRAAHQRREQRSCRSQSSARRRGGRPAPVRQRD